MKRKIFTLLALSTCGVSAFAATHNIDFNLSGNIVDAVVEEVPLSCADSDIKFNPGLSKYVPQTNEYRLAFSGDFKDKICIIEDVNGNDHDTYFKTKDFSLELKIKDDNTPVICTIKANPLGIGGKFGKYWLEAYNEDTWEEDCGTNGRVTAKYRVNSGNWSDSSSIVEVQVD